MKYVLTIFLIWFHYQLGTTQYNYGLEVCDQDVKIEGRLNIYEGEGNVVIGQNAGVNNIASYNTFVGVQSGENNMSGSRNTYIGYNTGNMNSNLSDNTMVGYLTGRGNTMFGNTLLGSGAGMDIVGWGNAVLGYGAAPNVGSANVMIGRVSGNSTSGSFNVFIGDSAGYHETGSRKLYIEASQWNEPDNKNPLIYGEFDNNLVKINGSFHITEFAKLKPRSDAPINPEEGTVYYDSDDKKVKVWTGTSWDNLN